ncbi:unnamed protein product [Orchesella dallaii]|uniref:DUF6606 domain-containing protein n=1 Tax=Orchesella dallaii TaxID=48710 RepID=A0ABP1RS30_9HEXA
MERRAALLRRNRALVEFKTSVPTFTDFIPHLIFPRKLPQKEESNRSQIEIALLKNFVNFIQLSDQASKLGSQTLKTTFINWTKLQSHLDDDMTLNRILIQLQEGETATIYVEKQNCTILFTKLNQTKMRIITFRASLSNEQIMSTIGSLKVTYPETVDIVPISKILLSPTFSRHVHNLSLQPCPIAMPKGTKAGTEFVADRQLSHPFVVTEFLVGMLQPESQILYDDSLKRHTTIQFIKKVRDEVNCDRGGLPFRRSGLWMSLKVVLQLSLQEEIENQHDALLAYKTILLGFITSISEKYFKTKSNSNNWDVLSQILVKLSRRAQKLSQIETSNDEGLEMSKQNVLAHTFQTIDEIHKTLTENWDKVQAESNSDSIIERITFSKDYIDAEITYDLKALNEHVNRPIQPDNCMSITKLQTRQITRKTSLSKLLKGDYYEDQIYCRYYNDAGNSNWDHETWIYDTEQFIREKLDISVTCKDLHALLRTYTKGTIENYEGDPVAFSRMTLLVLKIIQAQDEIAVDTYPLLRKYKSSIDPEMFNNLILPHKKEDMELLDSLTKYFQLRNDAAENFRSIIQSGNISASDFSVQFFRQCPAMIAQKEKMLTEMETKIKQKYDEVRQAKMVCRELQAKVNPLRCEREFDEFASKWKHYSHRCPRCKLNRELKAERNSVKYYQRPLPNHPNQPYLQDAVIFEFMIPEEIACLRDSLSIFLAEIYGQPLFDGLVEAKIRETWNPSFNQGYLVGLGSTVSSTLGSHYSSQYPDVLLSTESDFVVNNGLGCNYFRKPFLQFQRPHNILTYQINKTADSAPYINLQLTLTENRPTENDILASQYTCHEKLPLKEYVAYGSLRSGQRIQLRNLFMALSNQTISTSKEPVLALILQTIWEVGRKTNGLMEIHVDLYDKEFAQEFLTLIETLLKSNASNWSNPLTMMPLVMICIRILELSEDVDVKQYCSKLLKQARDILDNWWEKLDTLIENHGSGEDKYKEISHGLLITSVCSAFTFNVCSQNLFPYIISDLNDVIFWLHTVCRLNLIIGRQKRGIMIKFSKFFEYLVNHAQHRIGLQIQDFLHKTILQMEFKALHDFSCKKWKVASKSTVSFWRRCGYNDPADHVYEGKYEITDDTKGNNISHTITIDILKGTFLVDGHPPTHLPENISSDELFGQFFQHSRFSVQRDYNSFTTVSNKGNKAYKGNDYEFFFNKTSRSRSNISYSDSDSDSQFNDNYRSYRVDSWNTRSRFSQIQSELVVRELHEDYTLELLPPSLLNEQLAAHLIKNYTHWLHSKTGEIFFRLKSDDEKEHEKIQYVLCPETKTLMEYQQEQHEKSRRCIFSPKSNVFQFVTKNLARFEDSKYIDIILEVNEAEEQTIVAYLRRLNLTFELRSVMLHSKNFPGFFISLNQCLESLTGLRNGLILEKENVSGKQKLLLIQHGQINIKTRESTQQQVVWIDSSNLRSPPVFTFEVDPILKRLKAGNDKSAWLYLAALHAVTSSPFPDKFTGLTGTEMAMWILQSGFVWSCLPYDSESFKTLQTIRDLSPKRSYFPTHLKEMQTISWPAELGHNSYAAYDGYAIIADYLVKSSNRLVALCPKKEEKAALNLLSKNQNSSLGPLNARSYYRHLNSYNKVAHLETTFLEELPSFELTHGTPLSVTKTWGAWMQLGKVRMSEAPCFTVSKPATIYSLLMTQKSLPSNTTDSLSSENLNTWFGMEFRSDWLQLYAMSLHLQKDKKLEHEFTFLLGALLYTERTTLEQVINLHNIATISPASASLTGEVQYSFPTPVNTCQHFSPMSHNYLANDITKILRSGAKECPLKYSGYLYSTNDVDDEENDEESRIKAYIAAREKYVADQKIEILKLSLAERKIYECWPSNKIEKKTVEELVPTYYFDSSRITNSINSSFALWYLNYQLKLFVEKVDLELTTAWINFTEKIANIQIVPLLPKKLHFQSIKDEISAQILEDGECEAIWEEIFKSGKLPSLREDTSSMEGKEYCLELRGFA